MQDFVFHPRESRLLKIFATLVSQDKGVIRDEWEVSEGRKRKNKLQYELTSETLASRDQPSTSRQAPTSLAAIFSIP